MLSPTKNFIKITKIDVTVFDFKVWISIFFLKKKRFIKNNSYS
jgi:hypothetical protein